MDHRLPPLPEPLKEASLIVALTAIVRQLSVVHPLPPSTRATFPNHLTFFETIQVITLECKPQATTLLIGQYSLSPPLHPHTDGNIRSTFCVERASKVHG
jgi:hypothetical protein